jgi:hypothetical protein
MERCFIFESYIILIQDFYAYKKYKTYPHDIS